MIDLRSDTVTQPSEAMRAVMASAPVGDDVYGEDPSILALESEVATMFGHEDAVFVPSGSMGNQVCLRLLAAPGEEVLCELEAHIVSYELGAAAALSGIQTRTLAGRRGLLDAEMVAPHIRSERWRMVPTRAVAVEQTHNVAGGSVHSLEALQGLRALADETGIALHCDGARIWNAMAATGVGALAYGRLFDTLSVCLSKGLGAPVGSVVVTSAERGATARVLRKRMGGGMRQAGILAAAGLFALKHNLVGIGDDHRRAQRLAELLEPTGTVDLAAVETNIVVVDLAGTPHDALTLAAAAKERGVLVGVVSPTRVRLLTHLDVDDAGIENAGRVLRDLLA